MEILKPHFERAASECPSPLATHALSCLAQGSHFHAHINGPDNRAAKAFLEKGARDACFWATARPIEIVTSLEGCLAALRAPKAPTARAPVIIFSPQEACNASTRYYFVARSQHSANAAAVAAAHAAADAAKAKFRAVMAPIPGLREAHQYGPRGDDSSRGARGMQTVGVSGAPAGQRARAPHPSPPPPSAAGARPPNPPPAPANGEGVRAGVSSSSSSSSSAAEPPEEEEQKQRLTSVSVGFFFFFPPRSSIKQ